MLLLFFELQTTTLFKNQIFCESILKMVLPGCSLAEKSISRWIFNSTLQETKANE